MLSGHRNHSPGETVDHPSPSATVKKATEQSVLPATSCEPGPKTLVAAAAGGVLGAVVGEKVGHSTGSSIAGAALGALAGALAAELAGVHGRPAGIHEIVAYLQEHLGRRVTAYLSGAENTRIVGRWAKGTAQPRELPSQRLQSAYEVTRVLVDAYGAKAARTWFFGMNPLLDDEAPAYVLRSGQRPEDWEFVLPAARDFVET
jgi:hypothetical protein